VTLQTDDPRLLSLDTEMIQEAWAGIRRDCAGFIKAFVKIHNEDTGEPMLFALWPEQERVLKEVHEHRLNVILKARQLGFTWLCLAYCLWRMLCRAGLRTAAVSRTESEAKELVDRVVLMLRHLPQWMVTYGKPSDKGVTWESTSLEVKVHHPNGEDSRFQAYPAGPESARSYTASVLLLDEWAAQEYAKAIWTAAFPTINRPTGGKVIGLSTAKRGTFHEEVWNGAVTGDNGFHPIFVPWHADPRRDSGWYEATKKALPHAYRSEYPATPEEAFSVGEGAAFSEWDERIHVPFDRDWYPPSGWKIYRAYDSGYATRAACLWIAVDNDGRAIVYREYYPTQVTDPEQAKKIKELSKAPDGSDEVIAYTVCDPACKQKKSATGIDTIETFAKLGVPMIPGDNSRQLGWRKMHEWLKPYQGADGQTTARLLFTKACVNSRRTIPSLLVDKSNPEDVDSDGEDHCADALRYFLMSRPSAPISEAEKNRRRRRQQQASRPINKWTGY